MISFARTLDASGTAHLRELDQPFDLLPDAVVHGNGRLRTVCLDVIENRFAVSLGKDGPFQLHLFAACRGTASGKVRLHLLMRNSRSRIIERFLHPGTKPHIVRGGVVRLCKRKRAFVGGTCQ